jgi:hypothetical protein
MGWLRSRDSHPFRHMTPNTNAVSVAAQNQAVPPGDAVDAEVWAGQENGVA